MPRLPLALATFGIVVGCGPEPTDAHPWAPCRLPGLGGPARCGEVRVPLDRDDPHQSIALRVVVVPAAESPASDAVMLLAGGPGQAATEVFPPLLDSFSGLHRHRDLVMVDQRGTGGSSPLPCPEQDDGLSAEISIDVDVERIRGCATELGVVPRWFGTAEAVRDLEAVRDALGYETLDLVGGSYGTRVGLEYARVYPERARTLVLDGVAPLGMKLPLPFARDGQAALDAMIADCEAEPACAQAHGDLAQTVRTLTDPQAPAIHTVIAHPRSGERVELELDHERIAASIRAMLYASELTSILPVSLAQAREGHYAPLVGQLLAMGDAQSETFYEGMYLSVICAEDVRRISDDEIEPAVAGTFFGRTMIDSMRRACAAWPGADDPLPALPADAVPTVPTLVLSGALDPATPPRWGAQVARGEHTLHVVVPGAAHGTLGLRCVRDLVTAFVEAGSVAGLDPACVQDVKRAPFFIDLSGPAVGVEEAR